MTKEHPEMVGAATVFVVSDVTVSIGHYRDVLGFSVTFQYGTPSLMRACAVTRLRCTCSPRTGPVGCRATAASAYSLAMSTVSTPNWLHAGHKVLKPPQNYDYGMRDFDVVDLDGNQLTFGMGAPK